MQRYWEGQTTPEEEQELALYAARTDDHDFEQLRGVLGFLSIGHEKRSRIKKRALVFYPVLAALAACLVAVVIINHSNRCICYSYGEKNVDNKQIMASVESSLSDFFGAASPAETTLFELFER